MGVGRTASKPPTLIEILPLYHSDMERLAEQENEVASPSCSLGCTVPVEMSEVEIMVAVGLKKRK